MSVYPLQHKLSAAAILALAALVTWISFTQQPPDAFLFPRLISLVFLSLAMGNLVSAFMGFSEVEDRLERDDILNICPGIAVLFIYVFLAAKTLGFYTASTIAFFTLYTLYDPGPWISPRSLIKRLSVTGGFMVVIYCLFTLLLKVQIPKGMWL